MRWLRMLFLLLAMLGAAAHAGNAWTVTNISNQQLNFETFDPARGSWKAQSIRPNQRMSYTVSQGGMVAKFHIETPNRGYVEYNVNVDEEYTLGWSQSKGVWDLLRVANAAPNRNMTNAPPPDRYAQRGPSGSYEIHNTSNRKISFDTYVESRGTWKTQSLYPNASESLTFSDGEQSGKIRITTEQRGYVVYDVRAGWKYNIVWDDSKGVWDVRTRK